MAETEERRKNDKRMDLLERTLYGEQINGGNKVIGIYEKVDKMWVQFTFMFRMYKTIMFFVAIIVGGIITILVKLFMGGQ